MDGKAPGSTRPRRYWALLADPARYDEMRANALAGAERFCWENQEPTILSLVDGTKQHRAPLGRG
jgi:hypothetical protein